jgi:hypothetical protein
MPSRGSNARIGWRCSSEPVRVSSRAPGSFDSGIMGRSGALACLTPASPHPPPGRRPDHHGVGPLHPQSPSTRCVLSLSIFVGRNGKNGEEALSRLTLATRSICSLSFGNPMPRRAGCPLPNDQSQPEPGREYGAWSALKPSSPVSIRVSRRIPPGAWPGAGSPDTRGCVRTLLQSALKHLAPR